MYRMYIIYPISHRLLRKTAEHLGISTRKYIRLLLQEEVILVGENIEYRVVPKKTLNNGQFLMTERHSIHTANDNKKITRHIKGTFQHP
jgi:phage antirepressor YoqD-like protein